MSVPERKLRAPSDAQLEALISRSWPKEKMHYRNLSVMLDERKYQQILERARMKYIQLSQKSPVERKWADLERGCPTCSPEELLKPDPRLLDKTVHRLEYGGDIVLGSAIVVGGYRFTPSTSEGLHMAIEKVERGSVITRIIPLEAEETLQITDGGKAITVTLYGKPEDFMLEGIYIRVE